MKSIAQAEAFYKEVLDTLLMKKVRFLVGGTYGFSAYTGIQRFAKDFDIFVTKKDLMHILAICKRANLAAELLNSVWLGKIYHEEAFVDLIFAERHGIYAVDNQWFSYARKGKVLGKTVLLMPVEQMIRTKCYVQFRDKYDGSDINTLLLQYGATLDWQWLADSIGRHWQLLFAHLLNFAFVYPQASTVVPTWLIDEYMKKAQQLFSKPAQGKNKRTRGPIISYEYTDALTKWGYKLDLT